MSEKSSLDESVSDELLADAAVSIERSGVLSLGEDYTSARIALARTGNSITTRDTLAFARDHAMARDAVHARLSLPTLLKELTARGLQTITIKSAAPDRQTYLRRPDLGRTLSESAKGLFDEGGSDEAGTRLTIVIADGLSALAADRNAIAVIEHLLPLLQPAWQLTPVVVAEQARVALGDEIGQALGADLTVMMIGERPGLSAADSLGAYITWKPRPGRTNAERNCISNIRGEGLSPKDTAQRIAYFATQAKMLGLTGTALKDPAEQRLLADPEA